MIDWTRVAELRDEIGAEDFDEVLALFLSEVDSAVGGLKALCDAALPAPVEEQMHFLKGASLNLGFTELAELCAHGEAEAAAGRPQDVSPQEVRHCFDASCSRFQSEYEARFAA